MSNETSINEELTKILAEAFPSRGSLKRLFEGEFGAQSTLPVPSDDSVSGYALNLVQWASAREGRDDLILAALQSQKYNSQLQRLAERLGLDPDWRKRYGELKPLGPCGAFVHTLVVQPGDDQVLYTGMDNNQGIFRSDNGGLLWQSKSTGLTNFNVNYIVPSPHDNRIFAATNAGVWVSYNRGDLWAPMHEGYENCNVQFVLLSPSEASFWMTGSLVIRGGGSVSIIGAVAGGSDTNEGSDTKRKIDLKPGIIPGRLHISQDAGETWLTTDVENPNHAVICPQDGRVAYIASCDNGLFRTSDRFQTIEIITSFPKGSGPIHVAVSPTDVNKLVVGTLCGLYVSDDGGDSWHKADDIGNVQVSSVLFLSGEAGVILVASVKGVFESCDGGYTWLRVSDDSFFNWCMALIVADNGAVFVGTSGTGVYRRGQGQQDWRPRNAGFPPVQGWVRAVTSRSGKSYLSGQFGLYRSRDQEKSWDRLGFDEEWVTAIAPGPVREQSPRATRGGGGLSLSADGGQTIQRLNQQRYDTLYVGTSWGRILRSADDGFSWEELFGGRQDKRELQYKHRLPTGYIRQLLIARHDPQVLYALLDRHGLLCSSDAGRSWSPIGEKTLPFGLNTLHVSIHEAKRVFVGCVEGNGGKTSGGVFWSGDAGHTWTASTGISAGVASISEPQQIPGRLYAATSHRAIYRSDDHGRSFALLYPPEDDLYKWVTILVHPDNEALIWLGSSEGMLRSQDAGETWERIHGGCLGDRYYVNHLAYANGSVYAAMLEGVFKIPVHKSEDFPHVSDSISPC